jgi:H+-transporting ATPase
MTRLFRGVALALKAKVLRGGAWSEIAAQNIVPGDIIKIRLGDIVPADARLISGAFLSVDQAALTGESLPVSKKEGDLVYSGSIAKQGEMEAVGIATGGATFFGRTAKLVQKAGAASHFQAAVMRIGDFLIAIAAVLAVVLVAVQLSRGVDLLRLAEFVLILLVASVPVAMPAVLSMTMALGAKLLAREKAIVSRLESIEEMAGMEVLCSDRNADAEQADARRGQPVGADRSEGGASRRRARLQGGRRGSHRSCCVRGLARSHRAHPLQAPGLSAIRPGDEADRSRARGRGRQDHPRRQGRPPGDP